MVLMFHHENLQKIACRSERKIQKEKCFMKKTRDVHLNEMSEDQLECVTGCGDVDELLAKMNSTFGIPSDILNAYNNANKDTESDGAV